MDAQATIILEIHVNYTSRSSELGNKMLRTLLLSL